MTPEQLDAIELGAEDCAVPRHWSELHRLTKAVRDLQDDVALLAVANEQANARYAALQGKTPCTCEDVAHGTPVGALIEELRRLRKLVGFNPDTDQLPGPNGY